MSNSIAISPEQFIFAQDQELRTTSLKVAEAFGKEHSNVIKVIERTLIQVSDSFGKVNFNATEYEQNNNLGLPAKYKMYEITKDGFMFLVMGFTGKKAAGIKEAYINAFNLMHEKLFPVRKESLPAPRAKTYIQGGLEKHQQDEINDMIALLIENVAPEKRAKTKIMIYSAMNAKFGTKGMKHGYKNIPPEQFENITQLIARLPLEGELLEKEVAQENLPQTALLNISKLRGLAGYAIPTNAIPEFNKELDILERQATVMNIEQTDQQAATQLRNSGYLVAKASKHGLHSMVMDYIPRPLFCDLIGVVSYRMKVIGVALESNFE